MFETQLSSKLFVNILTNLVDEFVLEWTTCPSEEKYIVSFKKTKIILKSWKQI